MNIISKKLRQLKAIMTPSFRGGIKKIYADFFHKHESDQALMLHRDDLYTPGPPHTQVSRKMIELVQDYAGEKILDVGCGLGVNCIELNKRGFKCVGIEASPELAGQAGQRIEAYHMRAEKLDFPDKHFDTTIMLEVLEHVDDPYAAMEEILRVTRKNLILSVPNIEPMIECVKYNLVMHHFMEPTHVNFFTESMLERFLGKYFPHVQVIPYGQFFNLSGYRLYYHLAAIASFQEIKK